VLVLLCALAVFGRPLQGLNVTDIITGYGYPVQLYDATTDDGYTLLMVRIPHGINNTKASRGPVLLQHGLTDSCAGWVLNPPYQSLAFILADAGYDVWLGNNRGNGYSMVSSNPSTFWEFTWDEMALHDFPTQINFVLQTTGYSKLSYIGHSEGTIQAFAGLSYNPSISQKLNIFIALAPVAYVGNLGVPMLKVLADLDLDAIIKLLGVEEFSLPEVAHLILPVICRFNPADCGFGGTLFYGSDSYFNDSRVSYYTQYEPFPTSVLNIAHWAQGVRTNLFEMFDFGPTGNMQHYGQSTPPQYNLANYPSTLPTALFTGGIDGLADPQDVQQLLNQLPSQVQVYNRGDYGHLDFLLGYKAYQLTYPTVLQLLSKY